MSVYKIFHPMILPILFASASVSLMINNGLTVSFIEIVSNFDFTSILTGLSLNHVSLLPIALGLSLFFLKIGRNWISRNIGNIVKVIAISIILILIIQPAFLSAVLPSRENLGNQPIFVKAERKYSGKECLACHTQTTPGLVSQWNQSKHGSASIYCDTCHGSNHDSLIWPTGEQCRTCHANQVDQFNKGKHHLAWVAMVPVVDVLKLDESTIVKGCGLCHRIGSSGNTTNWKPNTKGVATVPGSKCDVCHTRHTFSLIEARKPEACSNCHMGFDHPAYEMYIGSKHGIAYTTRGAEYSWNYSYNEQWPNNAPVCITCHMDKGNHEVITAYGFYGILGPNVGPLANDTEWAKDNAEVLKALGVLTPDGQPGVLFEYAKNMRVARLSNEEFNQLRTRKMQICYRCHSKTYIDEQFKHYEAVTKNSIHLLAEGVRLVAELYKDDTIQKPESFPYNYPFMVAFYNSPTPIEQDLYLMLEEWHNRMFMGAFHQSADYMHWEGYAPMKEHLVRMQAEAEMMRRSGPMKTAEKGMPIPEITAAIATIIAVVSIIIAIRAERKTKKATD